MGKVTLSIDGEKIKELKKKAIDADMTLSDYLATAGTVTPGQEIKKQYQSAGGVPSGAEISK